MWEQLMKMLQGMAMPGGQTGGMPMPGAMTPWGIPPPPPPLPPALAALPRPMAAPVAQAPVARAPVNRRMPSQGVASMGGGSGQERNNGQNVGFYPRLGNVMQPKQGR